MFKYFVFPFTVVCFLSAFIAWTGGYNFDTRNLDVAMWTFITIVGASFVGLVFYDLFSNKIANLKE